MSNTKREPLLSVEKLVDEFTEVHPYHAQIYAKQTACWVRDLYEEARANDYELIQRLVDALDGLVEDRGGIIVAMRRSHKALDAAEAAGFKPSDR